MHLALRTHLYIPDATIIIYTAIRSERRKGGIPRWKGWRDHGAGCWCFSSEKFSSWTKMDNRKELLFLGKVKKTPKQSTELTRGQRPCVMMMMIFKALLLKSLKKNHSLNVSISHNFKQVFSFILQQCHKFQRWL